MTEHRSYVIYAFKSRWEVHAMLRHHSCVGVPEPITWILLCTGFMALVVRSRRLIRMDRGQEVWKLSMLATVLTIALVGFSAPVSDATPLMFIIQFDDVSIPGPVNWTGSYTIDSNIGLLTTFEATICRAAALLDCVFNNLFSVSLPAVDDPDDNDNVETDVLTPTNSAVLALRDGVTNEWQILDPFGSLAHGVYATRRGPVPESLFLCLFGLALLCGIRWRSIREQCGNSRPRCSSERTGRGGFPWRRTQRGTSTLEITERDPYL